MNLQRLVLSTSLSLLFLSMVSCGATSIEVPPPLAIVDTFPTNGADLQHDPNGKPVGYIEIVFSELVDGQKAIEKIKLTSLTESDQVDTIFDLYPDLRRGEAGVDEQTLSLTLLLNENPVSSTLPTDKSYRLIISKGLSAINGSVLPVDVIRRFTILP